MDMCVCVYTIYICLCVYIDIFVEWIILYQEEAENGEARADEDEKVNIWNRYCQGAAVLQPLF